MDSQENSTCARIPRAEVIARHNDALRKRGEGGVIVVTRGVRCLQGFEPLVLLKLVAQYDAFDVDNDPHGERDFSDVEMSGETLLWKVDYYDNDMLYASPDPANAGETQRVLTVMLATEW